MQSGGRSVVSVQTVFHWRDAQPEGPPLLLGCPGPGLVVGTGTRCRRRGAHPQALGAQGPPQENRLAGQSLQTPRLSLRILWAGLKSTRRRYGIPWGPHDLSGSIHFLARDRPPQGGSPGR